MEIIRKLKKIFPENIPENGLYSRVNQYSQNKDNASEMDFISDVEQIEMKF